MPDLLFLMGVAMLTIAVPITVYVHVGMGIYVHHDARRLQQSGQLFGQPAIWLFSTLLTGWVGATLYWLMHHSTLSRR